jgi:hypothetical protein
MDIFGEITDILQAYFECGKNTQAILFTISVFLIEQFSTTRNIKLLILLFIKKI